MNCKVCSLKELVDVARELFPIEDEIIQFVVDEAVDISYYPKGLS